MIVKVIETNSHYLERVREINEDAFPVEERMSVNEMYDWQGKSEVLGFYENEQLIGFTLILTNETVVFIVLLAIDNRYRGHGYGTKALAAIRGQFPNRQIILDFEEVIENSANYAQRVSRKRFYLRNGFHETCRYTILSGGRYEVVCSEKVLDEAALLEIMSLIHKHTPEFDERLFH